jgi:hypothetical protein
MGLMRPYLNRDTPAFPLEPQIHVVTDYVIIEFWLVTLKSLTIMIITNTGRLQFRVYFCRKKKSTSFILNETEFERKSGGVSMEMKVSAIVRTPLLLGLSCGGFSFLYDSAYVALQQKVAAASNAW